MIGENAHPTLRAITDNYLAGYIFHGGSAVKIACGADEGLLAMVEGMNAAACKLGYVTASINATESRLHLVNELFYAVARKIPWLEIAECFSRRLLSFIEFEIPHDEPLNADAIAESHGVTRAQFNKRRDGALRELVIRDPNYTRTFKNVILCLVGAAFANDVYERAVGLRVVEWLCGEQTDRRVLKAANLSGRINRQNARSLLIDLARWIRGAGFPGLLVTADISRYSISRVQNGNPGRSYTPSAALELFEMMRQFIDSCDEAVGLLLMFLTSSAFLYDAKHGVSAYPALKMRVLDDVYDSERPNLLAPLVMVSQ